MMTPIGRAHLLQLSAVFEREEFEAVAEFLGYDPPVPTLSDSNEEEKGLPPQNNHASTNAAAAAPNAQAAQTGDSMVYLRLESASMRLPDPPTEPPAEKVLSRHDLNKQGSLHVVGPAPTPLIPWSRLWPRLRDSLQVSATGHEVDLPTVVRTLERAESMSTIPRRRRRAWAERIDVWFDRSARLIPFWNDQVDVWRRASAACGFANITVRSLDEHDAHSVDQLLSKTSASIDARTPLLIVGDLGAYATTEQQEIWRRVVGMASRVSPRVVVLAPVPPRRWPATFKRVGRTIEWETARPLRAAGADAAGDALRARALLQFLSAATWAEPELFRDLRHLLGASASDAATEVDAWLDPGRLAADANGWLLQPKQARVLRQEFARLDRAVVRRVLSVIRRHRKHRPKELSYADVLVWRSFLRGVSDEHHHLMHDARRLVEAAAATLRGARGEPSVRHELGLWGRAFIDHLEPKIYAKVPDLGILWAAATQGFRAAVPEGLDPVALDAELGVVGAPRVWAVRQVGGALVLALRATTAWPSDVEGPGSPLCTVTAGGPNIAVKSDGVWQRVPLQVGTLLSAEPAVRIEIRSDHGALVVAPWEPEPWMSASGRDPYGLWCAFEVAGVTVRMRWIPPGRFVMGSPETEAGRWDGEGPQHEVTLTEGYWLGETPVTQALWKTVMGENPSRFVSDDRPVEQVSWLDCEGFIARVNTTVTGLDARFPTESEWEYACRAGTETATWAGDLKRGEEIRSPTVDRVAWYDGNSDQATHAVGGKPPNPWGLHDMLGNVYEWCEDWHGSYESGSVVDPRGPTTGSVRVIRGGSWNSLAQLVRAAYRSGYPPGDRSGVLGFRLARGQGLRSGGGAGVARSDTPRRGADAPRSAPVRDAPAPEIQGPPRPRERSR